MYYTGCDAHSKTCHLQHMDEDGALGLSMIVPSTPEGLTHFLDQLDAPTEVTFEASRGYWWLHELFKAHPNVAKVNVVDPRRSRNLAKELSVRAKNDRIDAEMLAEQTRRGLAPTIVVPTAEQLAARTLNRHRLMMMAHRTALINRIHGLLSMHGADRAFGSLPDYLPFVLTQLLEQIQQF